MMKSRVIHLAQGVLRITKRIEILSHPAEADDIEGHPSRPGADVHDTRFVQGKRAIRLRLIVPFILCFLETRGYKMHHFTRFLPEHWVQTLCMSKAEDRHELLPLRLMSVALRQQKPYA